MRNLEALVVKQGLAEEPCQVRDTYKLPDLDFHPLEEKQEGFLGEGFPSSNLEEPYGVLKM